MTTLDFVQNDRGWYNASFVSDGKPHAVELNREQRGRIVVYMHIGSLEKEPVGSVTDFKSGDNFIFKVDEPDGVTITIESETPVTAGGYE